MIRKEKDSPTQSTAAANKNLAEDQFEFQAGQYVHKFNELCRQNKLNKPNFKWKHEKILNKKKIKYFITQDQLGISVKVTDKSKAYAKLHSVKLAFEEALRILASKKNIQQQQQQLKDADAIGNRDKLKNQFQNINALVKMNKKDLIPAFLRVEQDIDIFLESECKMYSDKPDKQASPISAKTGSIESNPIEYSMIRKGAKYFDNLTPVTRVPSLLPTVPLPKGATFPEIKLQSLTLAQLDKKQLTDDLAKKEDDELEKGSTLRISSGFVYQGFAPKQTKKEIIDEFLAKELNYEQLSHLQTIRSKPIKSLKMYADLDIEMLQYLNAQKKLFGEAVEQIKKETVSSNTNYLRLLNFLLLQNEKISIEIKISSDFGRLSKKDNLDMKMKSKVMKEATTTKLPEKTNEKLFEIKTNVGDKVIKADINKQNESSVDAVKKCDLKKTKTELTGATTTQQQASPPKLKTEQTTSPTQQVNPQTDKSLESENIYPSKEDQLDLARKKIWLTRINCFFSESCFTTIIGIGKTTSLSINDAAIKMIQYFHALINF